MDRLRQYLDWVVHPRLVALVLLLSLVAVMTPFWSVYCSNLGSQSSPCVYFGFCASPYICTPANNFKVLYEYLTEHLKEDFTPTDKITDDLHQFSSKVLAPKVSRFTNLVSNLNDPLRDPIQQQLIKLQELQVSSGQLSTFLLETHNNIYVSLVDTRTALKKSASFFKFLDEELLSKGCGVLHPRLEQLRLELISDLNKASNSIATANGAVFASITKINNHIQEIDACDISLQTIDVNFTLYNKTYHSTTYMELAWDWGLTTGSYALFPTVVGCFLGPVGCAAGAKLGLSLSGMYVAHSTSNERSVIRKNVLVIEEMSQTNLHLALQKHLELVQIAQKEFMSIKTLIDQLGVSVLDLNKGLVGTSYFDRIIFKALVMYSEQCSTQAIYLANAFNVLAKK